MKRIIFSIFAASSIAVHAQEAPAIEPMTDAQKTHKRCQTDGKIAKSIMNMRQMGMPMSSLMSGKVVQESSYYANMVKIAYSVPRFSSQEMKDRSVEDFVNEVELMCFSRK